MNKKILSLILAAVMVLSMLPVNAMAVQTGISAAPTKSDALAPTSNATALPLSGPMTLSGSAAQGHGAGQGMGNGVVLSLQSAGLGGSDGDAGLHSQRIDRQHGGDHDDGQDQGKNLFVHSVTSLISPVLSAAG